MTERASSTRQPDQRPAVDWQPVLSGDLVELRPVRPDDFEALFQAASDPLIWAQHPATDRYQEDVFRRFFGEALQLGALVVVERRTGRLIGSSRYLEFDAAKSEVEIGFTFLARTYWGGGYNGEVKRLMMAHAFQFVDRVVFLVGATNLRSRRALEKIGAVLTDRRDDRQLGSVVIEHVVYEVNKPGR